MSHNDCTQQLITSRHWDYQHEEVRLKSADLMLDYFSKINPPPSIITGDFNAPPEFPSRKRLQERFTDIMSTQLLNTFNTWHPPVSRSIDTIFFDAARFSYVSHSVAGTAAESDHMLIQAVFESRKKTK